MDPNIKDESRNPGREEVLVRRLGKALDQDVQRGTAPCPDAELIAAYHDRALGPDEAAGCETHFATCSRCRKILAVLAVSDETPLAEKEVARLGELVAAASAPRAASLPAAKPVRPSRLGWRVRWLAPALQAAEILKNVSFRGMQLAEESLFLWTFDRREIPRLAQNDGMRLFSAACLGAAAVLAVWFAMRPPWRATNQSSLGTLIAQAPKTAPPLLEVPPADQSLKPVPAKNSNANSATLPEFPRQKSAKEAETAKPSVEAFGKKDLGNERATDQVSPGARTTEIAPDNERNATAGEPGGIAGGLQSPPPPLPAPVRGPLAQAQSGAEDRVAPPAPQAAASARQSVTVNRDQVTNDTSSSLGGLVNERKAANLPIVVSNVNTVLVSARSGTNLWRAGKSGSIERSNDSGKTWQAQTSPLRDEWLTGSAVSDGICWLAGRNGAIARTTDGENWEKIAPPSLAADVSGKLPDWIAVAASSAQSATITAADQRRYATQDGGKTWRAQ